MELPKVALPPARYVEEESQSASSALQARSLSSNLGPGLGQGASRGSLLTSNTASIFNWAGNLGLALQLLEMHLSPLFHYCLTDHPDLMAQNDDIRLR